MGEKKGRERKCGCDGREQWDVFGSPDAEREFRECLAEAVGVGGGEEGCGEVSRVGNGISLVGGDASIRVLSSPSVSFLTRQSSLPRRLYRL